MDAHRRCRLLAKTAAAMEDAFVKEAGAFFDKYANTPIAIVGASPAEAQMYAKILGSSNHAKAAKIRQILAQRNVKVDAFLKDVKQFKALGPEAYASKHNLVSQAGGTASTSGVLVPANTQRVGQPTPKGGVGGSPAPPGGGTTSLAPKPPPNPAGTAVATIPKPPAPPGLLRRAGSQAFKALGPATMGAFDVYDRFDRMGPDSYGYGPQQDADLKQMEEDRKAALPEAYPVDENRAAHEIYNRFKGIERDEKGQAVAGVSDAAVLGALNHTYGKDAVTHWQENNPDDFAKISSNIKTWIETQEAPEDFRVPSRQDGMGLTSSFQDATAAQAYGARGNDPDDFAENYQNLRVLREGPQSMGDVPQDVWGRGDARDYAQLPDKGGPWGIGSLPDMGQGKGTQKGLDWLAKKHPHLHAAWTSGKFREAIGQKLGYTPTEEEALQHLQQTVPGMDTAQTGGVMSPRSSQDWAGGIGGNFDYTGPGTMAQPGASSDQSTLAGFTGLWGLANPDTGQRQFDITGGGTVDMAASRLAAPAVEAGLSRLGMGMAGRGLGGALRFLGGKVLPWTMVGDSADAVVDSWVESEAPYLIGGTGGKEGAGGGYLPWNYESGKGLIDRGKTRRILESGKVGDLTARNTTYPGSMAPGLYKYKSEFRPEAGPGGLHQKREMRPDLVEEQAIDKDGNPAWTTDAKGNTVPLKQWQWGFTPGMPDPSVEFERPVARDAMQKGDRADMTMAGPNIERAGMNMGERLHAMRGTFQPIADYLDMAGPPERSGAAVADLNYRAPHERTRAFGDVLRTNPGTAGTSGLKLSDTGYAGFKGLPGTMVALNPKSMERRRDLVGRVRRTAPNPGLEAGGFGHTTQKAYTDEQVKKMLPEKGMIRFSDKDVYTSPEFKDEFGTQGMTDKELTDKAIAYRRRDPKGYVARFQRVNQRLNRRVTRTLNHAFASGAVNKNDFYKATLKATKPEHQLDYRTPASLQSKDDYGTFAQSDKGKAIKLQHGYAGRRNEPAATLVQWQAHPLYEKVLKEAPNTRTGTLLRGLTDNDGKAIDFGNVSDKQRKKWIAAKDAVTKAGDKGFTNNLDWARGEILSLYEQGEKRQEGGGRFTVNRAFSHRLTPAGKHLVTLAVNRGEDKQTAYKQIRGLHSAHAEGGGVWATRSATGDLPRNEIPFTEGRHIPKLSPQDAYAGPEESGAITSGQVPMRPLGTSRTGWEKDRQDDLGVRRQYRDTQRYFDSPDVPSEVLDRRTPLKTHERHQNITTPGAGDTEAKSRVAPETIPGTNRPLFQVTATADVDMGTGNRTFLPRGYDPRKLQQQAEGLGAAGAKGALKGVAEKAVSPPAKGTQASAAPLPAPVATPALASPASGLKPVGGASTAVANAGKLKGTAPPPPLPKAKSSEQPTAVAAKGTRSEQDMKRDQGESEAGKLFEPAPEPARQLFAKAKAQTDPLANMNPKANDMLKRLKQPEIGAAPKVTA
jgi:hypothetical protein